MTPFDDKETLDSGTSMKHHMFFLVELRTTLAVLIDYDIVQPAKFDKGPPNKSGGRVMKLRAGVS